MLHVLLGDASSDVDAVLDAAKWRKTLRSWIVPKKARPDNPALFHLPGYGFRARGVIGSEPKAKHAREYRAGVRDITALPVPVPLAFIRENHKAWKWPTYPRHYAIVDGEIQAKLGQLLDSYQATIAGEGRTAERTEPLIEVEPRSVLVNAYERSCSRASFARDSESSQMHSRYAYPFLIRFRAYALLSPRISPSNSCPPITSNFVIGLALFALVFLFHGGSLL